ncbi:MAG: ABC transporter ATP-binding protein [Bacteroidota bacterium]
MTASGSNELDLTIGSLSSKVIGHEQALKNISTRTNRFRPILSVKKVSKSFGVAGGKIQAIKDIDLVINRGELVSLVGPSGCGKSTLLNIIAGLEKPDFGEIQGNQIDEKVQAHFKERLLIFQEASLFPWLTVYDNVAYGLKIRKFTKEKCQQMAEKYLSLVQLSQFKEACIHQLSGGMKQRVALARALVLEPELLLMDEPFTALDVQTRHDMYRLLLKIREETGVTILFITHNVEEALVLSNRILVMRSRPGQIKREFSIGIGYPRTMEHNGLKQLRLEIIKEFIEAGDIGDIQGGSPHEQVY